MPWSVGCGMKGPMAMKYGPLAAQLRAASARGDRVVEYSFHDIDGLVGGLPASARTNRTWWANASRVQSLAWRDAGWHVEMVSLERERVRFERGARGGSCADRGRVSTYAAGQLAAAPVVERTPAASPAETSVVDAVLVGCVKTKARRPLPAGDLYRSPLFERRRAYAEASGASWYLLSSKWGLIEPDTVVAPYDLYLGDQPASYRARVGCLRGRATRCADGSATGNHDRSTRRSTRGGELCRPATQTTRRSRRGAHRADRSEFAR